jgi:hypothetical protein
MMRSLSAVAGLAATLVLVLVLSVSGAKAQVTQNGPYYATPSWDQTLPATTRFVVLSNFGGAAVLDRETGLIWTQTSFFPDSNWVSALRFCRGGTFGTRRGWRLPTLEELLSLSDESGRIPNGIFNLSIAPVWSATTDEIATTSAWVLLITSAGPETINLQDKLTSSAQAWCVRGGSGNTSPN